MKLYKQKIYRKNPDCDQARLLRIVKVNNERIAKGERSPIVLGHTPGSGATEFLPIDIGSMDNFQTDGEFLYSDWTIDDVFADAVKRHRGKSIELWGDDVVYPLSLLSHSRPALEVECIKFSMDRDGEHQTFTIPDEEIDMDAGTLKNLINECLQGSDLMARIQDLTKHVTEQGIQLAALKEQGDKLDWLMQAEIEEEQAEAGAVQPGEPPVPGEPEKNEAMSPEAAPTPSPEDGAPGLAGQEPEKNDMGMAMPSGTNTFVPTTGGGKKPDEEKKPVKKNYEMLAVEAETHRLEAENQRELVAQLTARLGAAEAEKANLATQAVETVRKYAMEVRRGRVVEAAKTRDFDPQAEMAIVEKMDDNQFESHISTVVVKYAMLPTACAPVVVGELPKPKVEGESDVEPPERVRLIVKYAMDHKISYEEADKKKAEFLPKR